MTNIPQLTTRFACLCIGALFALVSAQTCEAAEWQWSATVDSVISSETHDHPRAFLWIPPNCSRVRGVVIGQHNMEEEPILEHPKFRAALAEIGFAEVWVTPAWSIFFRFDSGAGEQFNQMMKALADVSGYSELATAPVVPIGHSAAASYPWNFAAWAPERTLAVISVSGQWPYYKDQNTPDWAGRNVDGIPGLVSMGEYEDAENRALTGLQQKVDHPLTALSAIANPGAGHFDVSDAKVEFLGLYIKKAAQYRLPPDSVFAGSVKLNPIDPSKQGWLADRWRRDFLPKAPAAPVGQYKGDAKEAFWYFDAELAHAKEAFEAQDRGKKYPLVGFVQNGKVVEQNPKLHERVRLQFLPLADGMSFKLDGTFLKTAPEGNWLFEGTEVGHPTGGGPVTISRICGPVAQTGSDTWAIRFDRMGTNNLKRSNSAALVAVHPGDTEYRRTVQQAVVNFPLTNTSGLDQKITFNAIPNQRLGAVSAKLQASSDANMPVYFYVREGPAEAQGDTLKFTPVPPRAKFPVKVTVVAWQWGRSIEPRIKSAQPVERSFYITR